MTVRSTAFAAVVVVAGGWAALTGRLDEYNSSLMRQGQAASRRRNALHARLRWVRHQVEAQEQELASALAEYQRLQRILAFAIDRRIPPRSTWGAVERQHETNQVLRYELIALRKQYNALVDEILQERRRLWDGAQMAWWALVDPWRVA